MPSVPPGISFLLQNLPFARRPTRSHPRPRLRSRPIHIDRYIFLLRGAWRQPRFRSQKSPPGSSLRSLHFSLPTTIAARIVLKQLKDERDAAKHNAVLPPRVKNAGFAGVGYPGELFSTWFEESGTFIFITAEPDHIKAVLATQFESFEKGPVFQQQLNSLLRRRGVSTPDGEMWKFHRAMTRPFFSKGAYQSTLTIFDRHAKGGRWTYLAGAFEGGIPLLTFQDLTGRFTMDSATEFLFNKNNSSHPSNQFATAFDEANGIMGIRTRRGLTWRLGEFWQDQVEVRMRTINKFLDPIIQAAKRGVVESHAEEGESLLDHLARHTDDQKVLRDETLNILLAGPPANTLTWAIYMLSQHPDVLRRLTRGSPRTSRRVPTVRQFEDMKDMKYLRAKLCRLYPAVMGYSSILTSPIHPSRQSSIPDRFLDERVKDRTSPPTPSFSSPFNAGPAYLPRPTSSRTTNPRSSSSDSSSASPTFRHVLEAQPPASRPPVEWKSESGPKGRDDVKGGMWVTMEEVGITN
ncbi:cytochrome P450 [Coprinellus micaceus]|uniref:Cytochrome P450 n=1 Tax=Coprinellus micaceus TaxID=71717 RepID=A0A4Y7T483_COPMI|nr:cytochrome P450 [Coprinellus micaceus]